MIQSHRGLAALALAASLAPALVGVSLAGPATASGGGDDRVVKTGGCSDSAHWKLKVKTDDNRLEVEGEVDSNRSGQTWKWRIKDNGSLVTKGSATTGGASGSFSIERKIANQAGTDHVVFRAKYPATGEVCVGTVDFG